MVTRAMPNVAPAPVLTTRVKPVPSSFYTAKPVYIDSLILLEDLARRTKRALQLANIPIRVPSADPAGTAPARRSVFWLKLPQLAARLSTPLRTSQYRHVIARLVVLSRYRPLLQEHFLTGANGDTNRRLAEQVESTLQTFSRDNTQGHDGEAGMLPGHVGVDELGRAYARGRRKESSARVWVVPAQDLQSADQTASVSASSSLASTSVATSVLVNAQPLAQFHTRVADREAVLYPLRLTGMLGAFNVFALVRGGGTTGQAGAIAHGISQALVAHFEHKAKITQAAEGVEAPAAKALLQRALALRRVMKKGEYLRTGDEGQSPELGKRQAFDPVFWPNLLHVLPHADGILKRDPRMVERKKTNKAKARKSYTWVKR